MRSKKGDIWVSAVLYLVLGVIAIALILGAAVPLINKVKDRNTITQTKDVLYTLDETIRKVANEGPGSQRELSPFIIGAGKLTVDATAEVIQWEMETEAVIQEPNTSFKEGVLTLELKELPTQGKYNMVVSDAFSNIDINLTSQFSNPFSGKYSVVVRHTGRFSGNKPEIEIQIN